MNTPSRDERGRLLPGSTANPNGRPARAKEQEMLDAITSAVGPDELKELIREAITIARSTQSARGLLAIAEFIADRTLGKVPVKVQATTTRFETMLAMLGSNEVMVNETHQVTED